jgi:hypothetical protein
VISVTGADVDLPHASHWLAPGGTEVGLMAVAGSDYQTYASDASPPGQGQISSNARGLR